MLSNWSCDHCWSRFGGRNEPAGMVLEPGQVADKLVAGMRRNQQGACRISYGEPTMYPEHLAGVLAEVLERTAGERLQIKGVTARRGDPLAIVVETNGSLLRPDWLDELAGRLGDECHRVVWSLGIKATTPEQLAALTGHTPQTAERFHRGQMDALMHLAYNGAFDFFALFLDRFTDPHVYATIQREVERARPGFGRHVSVERFKSYRNTQRFYTPKRFRDSGQATPLPS